MEKEDTEKRRFQQDKELREEAEREKYRSFKAFARAFDIGFRLLATIMIGVLSGWLGKKYIGGDYWMTVGIVTFALIAVFDFYRNLLRMK